MRISLIKRWEYSDDLINVLMTERKSEKILTPLEDLRRTFLELVGFHKVAPIIKWRKRETKYRIVRTDC